jgi:hypothetical protein
MAFKQGRPTNKPGVKRVKLQTYVEPETKNALEREARLDNTSGGQVIDKWFSERAKQNSRLAPDITKATETQKFDEGLI